jgi:hypothetical protein
MISCNGDKQTSVRRNNRCFVTGSRVTIALAIRVRVIAWCWQCQGGDDGGNNDDVRVHALARRVGQSCQSPGSIYSNDSIDARVVTMLAGWIGFLGGFFGDIDADDTGLVITMVALPL